MTAHLDVGCYSTVSHFDATTGCLRMIPESDIGASTKTVIMDGTTSTDRLIVLTASSPGTTETKTFASSESDRLGAVSVIGILPLVHHESDVKATGTVGGASTDATSTSNCAARPGPKGNSWDGLCGVLGVSLASIVLGAAVILQ